MPDVNNIILSGGGIKNKTLINSIKNELSKKILFYQIH